MSPDKLKRVSSVLYLVSTWAKAMIKQFAVLKMVEERMNKDNTKEEIKEELKPLVQGKAGPKVVTGKTNVRSKRGKIVRSAIDTTKAK
jgi:hypothetical protein